MTTVIVRYRLHHHQWRRTLTLDAYDASRTSAVIARLHELHHTAYGEITNVSVYDTETVYSVDGLTLVERLRSSS